MSERQQITQAAFHLVGKGKALNQTEATLDNLTVVYGLKDNWRD